MMINKINDNNIKLLYYSTKSVFTQLR